MSGKRDLPEVLQRDNALKEIIAESEQGEDSEKESELVASARTAVGILGTIIVVLAFATYPSEYAYPNAQGNESQNINPENNRWWLIGRVIYMDDTAAQWLMTLLTLAAVVLIFLTLRDTRQILTDTRNIGEAQVRAYLGPHDPTLVQELLPNGNLRAKISYKNTGQSPALKVTHETQVAFIHSVNDVEIRADEGILPPILGQPKGSIADISGQGVYFDEVKTLTPVPQNFSELIDAGLAVAYVRDWIKYEDVFGITHESHFCFHRDKLTADQGMGLSISSFGNHST